ncbi:PHD-type domain-containing protein [Mycena chlorophos]|uniref:PHD-type domain-containing protein n=1 Tax=Mycena chlorophos TaxID=658473 RepID=A0A8H6T654_MYCCL|nr:PHD-type domain-containing protein [Mycena chlorophos]
MSRRLDISSLLCADDPPERGPDHIVPETVVLAPHLAVRKYGPSHPRPPPSSDAMALDALAQAAALQRVERQPAPYSVPRYDTPPRRFWDTERPGTSPSPQMEPPFKKRRPSDVVSGSMSLRHTGDRSILNPEPTPVFVPQRPSSSSSSSALDATPFGYRGRVIDDRFGPQDTSPHLLPHAPDPIPTQRTEYTVIHLPERDQDDYVPDRKPKKSSGSRAKSKQQPPKDDEAHDWLLGQLPDSRKAPEPTANDKMDVDVDDELLSLVDGPSNIIRLPSADQHPKSVSRHGSPASLPGPSDRASMPPPASTVVAKKKKDPPKAKPKAPAKPRAKPAPKPKPKPSDKAKPSAIQRKSGSAAASASRSRSNSAMPGGSVGPDGSEKPDEEEDEPMPVAEDDKLYCICKTLYDEDRFMIACDQCDEWYHTNCVEMPDLVVELVDQFFCPPCIAKNPQLSLKTTYKQRCRNGLDHPEPDSPKACHKPAQGALSKYCSPECGYNNMKARIDKYTKNGGKKELLWESVKTAQKREAVVITHEDGDDCQRVQPSLGRVEREEASLKAVLDDVLGQRNELQQGMDIILWREQLLDLATERSQTTRQCGWDSRLLFGEEEWAACGDEVLESYEKEDGADGWWCAETDGCERHSGWQALRALELAKEKENKEEALRRLTTRERELRKRIEDVIEPFNRSCQLPASLKPPKIVNGNKKGKKRKQPV